MFSSFSVHFQPANACFFEVTLSLISFNSVSKSVFVTKFAYATLALKLLAAKILNSGVVMYLSLL